MRRENSCVRSPTVREGNYSCRGQSGSSPTVREGAMGFENKTSGCQGRRLTDVRITITWHRRLR